MPCIQTKWCALGETLLYLDLDRNGRNIPQHLYRLRNLRQRAWGVGVEAFCLRQQCGEELGGDDEGDRGEEFVDVGRQHEAFGRTFGYASVVGDREAVGV